jgi:hypothetical protein
MIVGAAVPLFLGDVKRDYSQLVRSAGGQVIRIGRGLDRISPLDAGPLGAALARMSGPAADRLRLEIRGRRLTATLALARRGESEGQATWATAVNPSPGRRGSGVRPGEDDAATALPLGPVLCGIGRTDELG